MDTADRWGSRLLASQRACGTLTAAPEAQGRAVGAGVATVIERERAVVGPPEDSSPDGTPTRASGLPGTSGVLRCAGGWLGLDVTRGDPGQGCRLGEIGRELNRHRGRPGGPIRVGFCPPRGQPGRAGRPADRQPAMLGHVPRVSVGQEFVLFQAEPARPQPAVPAEWWMTEPGQVPRPGQDVVAAENRRQPVGLVFPAGSRDRTTPRCRAGSAASRPLRSRLPGLFLSRVIVTHRHGGRVVACWDAGRCGARPFGDAMSGCRRAVGGCRPGGRRR